MDKGSLKNHKHKGFLRNTGPDPLTIDKATKPAFIVGPSSLRWRADDDPLLVLFGSSLPSQKKEKKRNKIKIKNK